MVLTHSLDHIKYNLPKKRFFATLQIPAVQWMQILDKLGVVVAQGSRPLEVASSSRLGVASSSRGVSGLGVASLVPIRERKASYI